MAMDININPVSGVNQYNPPKTTTDDKVQPPAPIQRAQAIVASNSDYPDAQARYEEAIKQAALSFKDFYALSDQKFSIFKDATGQYITRYVSLHDSSITYVPAPVLMKYAQTGNTGSVQVAINA